MNRAILILGLICAGLVLALTFLARYVIGQKEFELNQKRTEKARETRLNNLKVETKNETENEKVVN